MREPNSNEICQGSRSAERCAPRLTRQDQGEGVARAKTSRAHYLRNRATDEERILWSQLRNRKLAGFKFRRQHQLGPLTLDFFCPAAKLSVEIDGRHHGHPELKKLDED